MARTTWWPALLVAAALAAGCGGADNSSRSQSTVVPAVASVAASGLTTTPAAGGTRAAGTPTATAAAGEEWKKLNYSIPADDELPDRVVYQGAVDLGNESAAEGDQALLQQFKASGRQTGIQFFFTVEAGARTVSIGVSYYDNENAPRMLLHNSGDPTAPIADPRFEVAGLGDEYIAQRVKLGRDEGAAQVINIAWVRGRYFVSLADLGVKEDTPPDVAVALARNIDQRLKNNPRP